MSWDYAKPSQENNEDCLPCLFIQFCVIENGRRVSKILQIFSRQAVQMDALIATFVDELKQRAQVINQDILVRIWLSYYQNNSENDTNTQGNVTDEEALKEIFDSFGKDNNGTDDNYDAVEISEDTDVGFDILGILGKTSK